MKRSESVYGFGADLLQPGAHTEEADVLGQIRSFRIVAKDPVSGFNGPFFLPMAITVLIQGFVDEIARQRDQGDNGKQQRTCCGQQHQVNGKAKEVFKKIK